MKKEATMVCLRRQLAQWLVGLRYVDLPPFEAIIAIRRDLDRQDRADKLIQLTLKPAYEPHGHRARGMVRP
jgi:hypothetical protein